MNDHAVRLAAAADKPHAAPIRPPGRLLRAATLLAVLTVLTLLVGLVWWTVRSRYNLSDTRGLYLWEGVAWALFAVAVVLLRRLPARRAVPLILLGAVALQLAALAAPPRTSDDSYRYIWDGRVQAAGISPYRYAPEDPALTRLRDPWLFPPARPCQGWNLHHDGDVCAHINRLRAHTIYPPVAEVYFLAVHALSPANAEHKPIQVGAAVLAVATTVALLLVLRRTRGDPRLAVLWAWCPAVAFEAGNNAHVDVLGALLMVLGLGVLARHTGRRRLAGGGALLGLAVAVKLFPALALPGALRRRPGWVAGSALAVFVLVYVPYVVMSGAGVLGFLPGYLKEEGYEQSAVKRFGLLRLVLPDAATPYVAVLLLVALALLVMWRGDPDRPWRGALVVTGGAMLVFAPGYPWYALLVVALVALDGRWEWLGVPMAGAALYYISGAGFDADLVQKAGYGGALLLVLVVSGLRWRAARRVRLDLATVPVLERELV